MNTQALIEEVKSDLNKYSDAGLIDQDSLYRDIVLGLKRFGNDIMVLQDKVVEIKDGQVSLPEYFFSLEAAYKCEPYHFQKSGVEIHSLQSSLVYKERIEQENKWSECEACCNEVTEKIIRENIYFNGSKLGEFRWRNPQILRLSNGARSNVYHPTCKNNNRIQSVHEIYIKGTTLYANFNEGSVYIRYYGLPQDEDGYVEIPESPNGHLESYLEYHLKRRLAERLMSNNDALGLGQLYTVYDQREREALRNAQLELKWAKLTPSVMKKAQRVNKLESLQYEAWL